VSDNQVFKVLVKELEGLLHNETIKRAVRDAAAMQQKTKWKVGWFFNMGRITQQRFWGRKKDGTSAFDFQHPFF